MVEEQLLGDIVGFSSILLLIGLVKFIVYVHGSDEILTPNVIDRGDFSSWE